MKNPVRSARAKSRSAELAVLGGAPAFAEPLHVGRPNLGDAEAFLARVRDAFDRCWLTNNGPYVQELEARLASLLGVRHCIALSNGTQALELMLRAAGVTGEVIVPSFTFVATAHAAAWVGLTPVFADVDPVSHNLSRSTVEPLITGQTSAILAVHLWGRGCGAEDLERLGVERGLQVFFDAAHAFGCACGARALGSLGRASAFSFHATKCFHTFEGGAIATNDAALAGRLRLLRNFGFAGFDLVVSEGTNAKMNEVSAAMGLTLLDGFDAILDWNRRNFEAYRSRLSGMPGFRLVEFPPDARMNYQYIVVEVDERAAGLSRDELLRVLTAENVVARRYFYPGVHRMEPYRSLARYEGLRLPATERLTETVLCLPTGNSVSEADIDGVAGILRAALSDPGRVRQALAGAAAP